MKFWVCCEVRDRWHRGYRGYALLLDWQKKKVVRRYAMPVVFDPSLPDDAVGKYSRGCRVMLHDGNSIFVLTQGGFIELNAETMTERRRFRTDYNMGGHYMVKVKDADGFWFNCPALDSAIRVGRDGLTQEFVQIANIRDIAVPLKLNPTRWNGIEYYKKNEAWIQKRKLAGQTDQLHLNTLQLVDGELYGFSCTLCALFKLQPEPRLVHVFDDLADPHDGIFVGRRFVVNDSAHSRVIVYHHESMKRVAVIDIPRRGESKPKYLAGYVRGMEIIDGGRVLIGTAPLAVYEIDILEGKICDEMIFSQEVNHTCHGINRMPDDSCN